MQSCRTVRSQRTSERTKITSQCLSAILGNIKQESNFRSYICEEDPRVPYDRCVAVVLWNIQWTTESRYNGLGSFCKKYGCDPSKPAGQVRYMINEDQFQSILPEFEGGVDTVAQYMVPCYYWNSLGNQGNRELYGTTITSKN